MNITEFYRIIEQKERKITSLKQENGNLLVKLRDEKQLRIGGFVKSFTQEEVYKILRSCRDIDEAKDYFC